MMTMRLLNQCVCMCADCVLIDALGVLCEKCVCGQEGAMKCPGSLDRVYQAAKVMHVV